MKDRSDDPSHHGNALTMELHLAPDGHKRQTLVSQELGQGLECGGGQQD